MTDQQLLPGDRGHDPEPTGPLTAELPLLTRLNRRGFRLLQAADLIVLLVVAVGSMYVRTDLLPGRGGWDWPTYEPLTYIVSFTVIIAIFMATIYFGGLYEREPRLGAPPILPRAMRETAAAGGIVAILNLIGTGAARELGFTTERAFPMPIPVLIALIVVGALGLTATRRVAHLLRYRNEGPPRLLVVGAPEEVEVARRHVATEGNRAEVVGTASDPSDLLQRVQELDVSDVVLLSSEWLDTLYPVALTELEIRNVTVLQRVTAKETLFGLQRIRQVGGMPFVLLRPHTMALSRERFKRVTDLTILILTIPLWVPVLAFVTLYQLAVAGRPLLYHQERVGAGGRSFQMIKFRTMVPEAEAETGAVLAEEDDPRVIPACRWVRASRLDELPQLWNVVKGEMSLVGPRPERPELTVRFEQLIPGYGRRHEIPPGMTGLAQIHGRYHTDPEYKLGYDLQYLVNWSPILDLEILVRTVWVVLARRI